MDTAVRGAILGGYLGDCYGYIYEDKARALPADIKKMFETSFIGEEKELIYTDDTQLALALLRSCREQKTYNPNDVARQFATDYFEDGRHRYYGGNIVTVFRKLKDNGFTDPYTPASEQFSGRGSFGNGGGMRASPAAVYGHIFLQDHEHFVVDTTKITHTNEMAIIGALMQAKATLMAVKIRSAVVSADQAIAQVKPVEFVVELIKQLEECKFYKAYPEKEKMNELLDRLNVVKNLLNRALCGDEPTVEEIVKQLGNTLEAVNSCPTAIYVFLRSTFSIPYIELENHFLRCLTLAFTLSGDTDTIGCMAGAIMGALIGCPAFVSDSLKQERTLMELKDTEFPTRLLQRCERHPILEDYANWLADNVKLAASS